MSNLWQAGGTRPWLAGTVNANAACIQRFVEPAMHLLLFSGAANRYGTWFGHAC